MTGALLCLLPGALLPLGISAASRLSLQAKRLSREALFQRTRRRRVATIIQRSNRRLDEIATYPRNALNAPTVWPNVGLGTEFFAAETGASIRSHGPIGRERPQAKSKKSRQWRAKLASLHKAPDGQTEWWRMQSDANPSLHPNSLLTGKLTGNFVKIACLV